MKWGLPWPGAECAARAEASGARAFCAGEFSDANAYVTSAEMALRTSAAMVGPGVAYAFARSPFVHASAVRHLSKWAPGRVFLGLGSGTPRMNRDWFAACADHPAARMAELVEAIRAYLQAENGEAVRYSGRFYTVDADIRAPVLGRLDVPILIGAFNRIMLRTAGRVADGVLGHGLFTDRWWTETAEPALATGCADSGRDPAALHRWGWLITAINDADPVRAIRDARMQIAFYLTVRTYDPLVELHGWQDQVAAIRAAFGSGRPDQIGDHVTDDMLWSIAVCGDAAQAHEMLRARKHLPDTAFLAPPSFLVGTRRRLHYDAAAIAFAGEFA
ncbi:LLM class flavin-dependent oxidoreductase [Mycobacterium branderi]|uniref:5,10-methylene tetrahydromethanopterin reductase n=1 Tax=Mycobacterium branderi TaxID=43348 RepID=A0A7I7WD06_9MYCO|nr:LLM class flavin-dependent oxidoreductase [Mycobacterium branderi]MCV7231648.1 LLM class flavin-dependent oxidoreductase [Mycobacterium branderi]ORA40370.1 5,10-methylene tetrahydromethanopterin reductase [Mycobacterium branderi]BBZ14867.1 N5,N10-methylene tetrahydromethanopterin reductase [Mycobacterium branderi]